MFRSSVILLALLPFTLQAKDLSPDEARGLEQRFIKTQKATRTLRTDFEQVIRMPGMREPVVSKGEFFYRAPDELRVTFTEPAGDSLLLRSETLEISRGGKTPAKKPASDRAARALVALRNVLRGLPESAENQMNHQIAREGDEFIVTITPAVRSPQMPEKIENRVAADSLLLRAMTITLPQGIFLEYRFSNPRRDAPADALLSNTTP